MRDKKLNSTPKNERVCPYCQHKVDDFESHFNRSFKDGETLSCSECNLVILNALCLLNHRKNVHQDAVKVFSCETCCIDFSSRKYLFIHKKLNQHKQKEIEKEFEAEIVNSQEAESFENEVIDISYESEDDLFDKVTEFHETEKGFEIQKLETRNVRVFIATFKLKHNLYIQ